MKDEEARQVINQLTRQIKYLDVELHRVKNPHVKGCVCELCSKWRSNPALCDLINIGNWWKK